MSGHATPVNVKVACVTSAPVSEAGERLIPADPGRPSAWQRAAGALRGTDPVVGWITALGITALALLLRLWHLREPEQFEFDETYYAKDAWALLEFGYVRGYDEGANEAILAGDTTSHWQDGPSMTVHPEVGKWMIALGIRLFGMDPFGWRVAAAVVGSLMVLVLIRMVRRMTGSDLIAGIAGVLLAADGLHFVLSRLALLDIFAAFFTLLAVHCMIADRDWLRRRLAARVTGPLPAGAWGPRVLWRPWLLASGIVWGLAVGTKWNAAIMLAAFGLLVWAWSAGARRSFGIRWPVAKAALLDGVPAAAYTVLVAAIVYTLTWTGWLINAHEYEEHLSSTQYTQYTGEGHCQDTAYVADDPDPDARWPTATEPDASGPGEVTQSLRSLWFYHRDVYVFHANYLSCTTHTYASKPWAWLLLNRPVGVAADTGIQPGTRGCDAPAGSDCLKQVILLGTPLLWWGGVIALLVALGTWLGARDWRAGVAVVGVAASWLPWFAYADRPIFSYYAIVTLPFLVLAIALAIGRLLGPDPGVSPRRTFGAVIAGSYVVLVLVNFAWFWPIYTNELLTKDEWLQRIWFSRWI